MKTYEAKDIRNVLLVGHGGAGKTTLLEAMQFASGATTRMGTVEDGNTVSDFEPEEIKKGISVSLGMAPVEWSGVKVNVLDAPGYADFIGDVRTAIRAVDAVVLVVSAVDGVEVQTEVAWELAIEAGLPRAILINKLDRERASFERTLEQLVQAFGTQVAPLELPLGEEHDFEGVADLLGRKAYRYGTGPTATEGEWPDDIAGKADPFREKLMEAVAESDDALIEKYLEEGELSEDEVVHGVKRGFAEARIAPVLCAAAARPIGVDRVLQFIADEFPSPIDRGPVTVVTKGGEEKERACDPGQPLTSYVFKTVSDPYVGHITMFRVFSGTLRPDSSVYNATKGTEERIGQLFALRGKEHETLSEVPAGDIAAVAKLAHTTTGDTFSTKDDPVTLPADRDARTAARVRDHAEDQGRRGQALDRALAPARGGPDAPHRALGRDPRDRDVRDGRGPPGRADRTDEAQVRRRGDHVPGQDRVPRDRPRAGQGRRSARQADRWPRSVRDLQRRGRAAPAWRRGSSSSTRSSAARSPTRSSARSRRASSRRCRRA